MKTNLLSHGESTANNFVDRQSIFSFKPFRFFVLFLMFGLVAQVGFATNYYSKGNVAPHLLASWSSTTDGTGAGPANFTAAGDQFIIQSPHSMAMLTTASWTVTGNVVINSGATLTVNNTLAITGTTTNVV